MKHRMRSRLKRACSVGLFIFLVSNCVGCGKENTDQQPETAPVTGSVVYHGEPVEDGLVTFHPENAGHPAMGTVDANGNFTLTTYKKADGAVLGKHTVTIEVIPKGANPGMEAESGGGISIPLKYKTRETSPLTAEVAKGENKLQLVLED